MKSIHSEPDAPKASVEAEGQKTRLSEWRARGWMVAVHNDYRMHGELFTFWLLTDGSGRYVKGEGMNDEVAFDMIEDRMRVFAVAPSVITASPALNASGVSFPKSGCVEEWTVVHETPTMGNLLDSHGSELAHMPKEAGKKVALAHNIICATLRAEIERLKVKWSGKIHALELEKAEAEQGYARLLGPEDFGGKRCPPTTLNSTGQKELYPDPMTPAQRILYDQAMDEIRPELEKICRELYDCTRLSAKDFNIVINAR